MKFNFKQLREALQHLELKRPSDINAEVEITVREEDIQDQVIGSLMTIEMKFTKAPGQYDSHGTKVITVAAEVFPINENRNPNVTYKEEYILKPKD